MAEKEEEHFTAEDYQPDADDEEHMQSLADLPDNLLEEAMKQLTNPNKPLLLEDDEVTKKDDNTTNTDEKHLHPWDNPDDVAYDPNTMKNTCTIICPFCRKSIIMLAKAGTLVDKPIFLPYPNSTTANEGDTYTHHFKLTSKMDFENIEVRRAVPGETHRYLTCGDCGSGPVGITYDSDHNKIFYVCHNRVRYVVKKK